MLPEETNNLATQPLNDSAVIVGGFALLKIILSRREQPENTLAPILVMLSDIVTCMILVQLENALLPMLITLFPSIDGGTKIDESCFPFAVNPIIVSTGFPGDF